MENYYRPLWVDGEYTMRHVTNVLAMDSDYSKTDGYLALNVIVNQRLLLESAVGDMPKEEVTLIEGSLSVSF